MHPTLPGQGDGRLEIFEAGTGHGALTLYLSRAIHAANSAPPIVSDTNHDDMVETYTEWQSQRRAIIHTLDISEAHSRHAQKTIRNFRGSMYAHNIDFHTGTIDAYLKPRIKAEEPFLNHAILDLPNTHSHIDIVTQAMKENGTMIIFCPSITQINACLEHVKEQDLPLFMETVLEIGGSVGVGGKEWDVRRVKVKNQSLRNQGVEATEPATRVSVADDSMSDTAGDEIRREGELESVSGLSNDRVNTTQVGSEGKWEMVCRPKVGSRIVGGGFVALFRKKAP